MSVRTNEIYVQRDIITALSLIRVEGESVESLAEKYLKEAINNHHPGLFDVIAESNEAYSELQKANQARFKEWQKASPCCNKPVDEDLKRCPQCQEPMA